MGEGARQWLIEACAAGAHRVPSKMREALTLARLVGEQRVDRALGIAAVFGRFADGDLADLLDHASDDVTTKTVDETTPCSRVCRAGRCPTNASASDPGRPNLLP